MKKGMILDCGNEMLMKNWEIKCYSNSILLSSRFYFNERILVLFWLLNFLTTYYDGLICHDLKLAYVWNHKFNLNFVELCEFGELLWFWKLELFSFHFWFFTKKVWVVVFFFFFIWIRTFVELVKFGLNW